MARECCVLVALTFLCFAVAAGSTAATPTYKLEQGGCKTCSNLKLAYVYDGAPAGTISYGAEGNVNWLRTGAVHGLMVTSTVAYGFEKLPNNTLASASDCCQRCAAMAGCNYWQMFSVFCTYLKDVRFLDFNLQQGIISKSAPNYFGGKCNGDASATDDPHLIGAHGTRFDFNGQLSRSFCLFTDRQLHINMFLDGYLDGYAEAGKKGEGVGLGEQRNPIHSWIRQLAFLWKDPTGKQHSVVLVARAGKEQKRGDYGFIKSVRAGKALLAIPKTVNDKVAGPGGFTLTFLEAATRGHQDMDVFNIAIEGLLNMEVSLRVAHPLLQQSHEAFAHFNVKINDIDVTPEVHGVLGQTYRTDASRLSRNAQFQILTKLLNSPVHADGNTGKGFLDGDVADYLTSDVDSADCKFASAWKAAN